MGVGIFAHAGKLLGEVLLNPVNVVGVLLIVAQEGFDFGWSVCGVFTPVLEFGGVEPVAQYAECGIRFEPFLILFDEFLEGFGACYPAFHLLEKFTGIGILGVIDAFVVDFLKRVQLFGDTVVVGAPVSVGEFAEFAQAQIHRMQREA